MFAVQWFFVVFLIANAAACGNDRGRGTVRGNEPDTGLDIESDTNIDTSIDEDICWRDTVRCTLECGEGSHCVVPGICRPLDDPGWQPDDYADPRDRADVRSMLTEDGRFRGPVGVIDDLRFPQSIFNNPALYWLYVREFPDVDWFGDHGPHVNYPMPSFARDSLGLREVPDVAERELWHFGLTWVELAYMHLLRYELEPILVMERAQESPLMYRMWHGELVLNAGQTVRQGLDEAREQPVAVRPILDGDGRPVLLAEWVFATEESRYSEPASAVLLAEQNITTGVGWDADGIGDRGLGPVVDLPMHASTINRNLQVVDGSVQSVDSNFPAEYSTYMLNNEPPASAWPDNFRYASIRVGTFVISGLLSAQDLAQSRIWAPWLTDCDCVRRPDSFAVGPRAKSGGSGWLPVWEDSTDPFDTCEAELRTKCTELAEDGISLQRGLTFFATCDRESQHESFVRFTRVVPAVAQPAAGWVPDTPPPDAEGSSSNTPAPAPDGE